MITPIVVVVFLRWPRDLLAVGNDLDYDQIFLQQLMNYGSQGDLVIAISGSGNSPNVLNAVEWANQQT